jgi:hypothetical protein
MGFARLIGFCCFLLLFSEEGMFAWLVILPFLLAGMSGQANAQRISTSTGGDGGRGGDVNIYIYGGSVVFENPGAGAGGAGGAATGSGPKNMGGPFHAALPQSSFATRDNRDIYGNDISVSAGVRGVPNLDIGACAKLCGALPACVAFSFDRWNKLCFPKNKISVSLLEVRSTIGVKRPLELPNASHMEAKMQLFREKKLRGASLATTGAATTDQCQSNCQSDLRCVGFTFNRLTTSDSCTSFKLIDGWDPDVSFTSGYKAQTAD